MPLHSLGTRYQLGELIGTGGMSDVYRATDTLLGRDVAVKIMRADLARDTGFRDRFRREAQNGGSLNHPAIVAVYDTGDTEVHGITVPYIVMELVHGKTLREIIHEGQVPPEDAAKMLIPVCEALQVSHDAGIIHRDIKPANIMITPTGGVKVMDFGIARALGDATSAITATAAVVGTAQYLSPEQARGKTADVRSDVYATGCVLYELVTARPPFSGDSPLAIAYQHVESNPEPPSDFIKGLSPTAAVNIDSVVLTAMAKHPEDRYQTAEEFADDLRRLQRNSVALAARNHVVEAPTAVVAQEAKQLPTRTAQIAPRPAPRTPRTAPRRAPVERKSPWGKILAALVILSLLGAGGYYAWTQRNDSASQDKKVDSPNITIPDLGGKTEAEAAAELTKLGLQVERKEEASPTVPKGMVIATNPAVGSQVRPGSTVALTVSTGKEIVEVPSLSGMDTETASQTLTQMGLQLDQSVKESYSDTVAEGLILEQSPGAGSQVSKGSKVKITVSKGVQLVRVPVITGMKWENAESNLTSAGFVPQVKKVDSLEPEGTVISAAQSGQQLTPGSTVVVEVSNGQLIKAPNIVGMTQPAALKALRAAGWTAPDTSLLQKRVPTQALVDQGKISRQDPPAGGNLRKDGLVNADVLEFQLLP